MIAHPGGRYRGTLETSLPRGYHIQWMIRKNDEQWPHRCLLDHTTRSYKILNPQVRGPSVACKPSVPALTSPPLLAGAAGRRKCLRFTTMEQMVSWLIYCCIYCSCISDLAC
jgi:hypothetical protein